MYLPKWVSLLEHEHINTNTYEYSPTNTNAAFSSNLQRANENLVESIAK